MLRMRGIKKAPRLTALMACATISLLAPSVADAAVSKYAPDQNARDFQGSAGGWTSSSDPDPLCILPGAICPAISGGREADGGAGGGGYMATNIDTTLLNTVLATNTGVLSSPGFTYRGAKGKQPQQLNLRLKRKSELADLLAIPGNSAELSVSLVPAGGGAVVEAIEPRPIGAQAAWSPVGAKLAPGELEVGKRYRIEIASRFTTIASLLPSGSVGYDDVVLSARRKGSRGGGANPGKQIANGIGKTIKIKGNKARVRVACPRSAKPGKCRLKVSGLQKRKGPKVTNTKRVNLAAGQRKVVRLKVVRKRRAIARRGRMFVKVRYRMPGARGKVVKPVRVRAKR
ncbi:hypothetical protein HJD18_10320 [Thermoleophilia bacterium SCSIO 60948]|nr:hypothetical protein HJD18_10320 [Thermoleophilia bacterium SCSIO 60948]